MKDHYPRFCFRIVHPNRSQLERGGAQMILENQVMPEIDHFTSLTFEEVCQQFFWQAGLSGNLPYIPNNIGNRWNANEEIDLIVMGERRDPCRMQMGQQTSGERYPGTIRA